MDPTGATAQRFPLIARPRPPCTALPARISALAALADRAASSADLGAASRVYNQAALIASDCGQPDLAQRWCHRHTRAHLARAPHDPTAARHALEPLVNLARLHIRAGNGPAAINLIEALYQAVLTRTDTTIDGITVPTADYTANDDHHVELSQWLWSIYLADGSRALTTAGRWHDAETHLRRHNGIGRRMLDGRQVAVIARAIDGHHTQAHQLLAETQTGEPWEDAVTACLTVLTQPPTRPRRQDDLDAMVIRYRHLRADPTLLVFRTRLGLSIIDAIGDPTHPTVHHIADGIIAAALNGADGYAARDLLAHDACLAFTTAAHRQDLATMVARSGLGQPLTSTLTDRLEAALATSDIAINRNTSATFTTPQLRSRVARAR